MNSAITYLVQKDCRPAPWRWSGRFPCQGPWTSPSQGWYCLKDKKKGWDWLKVRKSVSDVHLTSKCVCPSTLICDDAVTLPMARTVDIIGQILKWRSTKLGMILLKFHLLGLDMMFAKHSQAGFRHDQARLPSKSTAKFKKNMYTSIISGSSTLRRGGDVHSFHLFFES